MEDVTSEFVVYVLWSSKYNKRYIGMTSSLIERFKSHNYLSTKGWTVRYRPWAVVYVKFFTRKSHALHYEKFLKSGQGRKWLNTHVFYK